MTKLDFLKKLGLDGQERVSMIVFGANIFAMLTNMKEYNHETNILTFEDGELLKTRFDNALKADQLLCIYKQFDNEDDAPKIVYGPLITDACFGGKIDKIEPPEFSKNIKRQMKKTNVHCLTLKDKSTISFYLSFLRDKSLETLLYLDDSGFSKEISVQLDRNKDDSFGFRSFTLSIYGGVPGYKVLIKDYHIPDSYKCFDDLIGYPHGIYRQHKNDLYKIEFNLDTGNLVSYEC